VTDLTCTGIGELLDLYRSRQASPRDEIQACLERIAAIDPDVDAVVTLCADRALAAAEASERCWLAGHARPLEGVPFGLKDVIATAGMRTTAGSRIYLDHIPAESATVVERLVAAGAILLAKLHTTELSGGTLELGDTRNPWDTARHPGGSSSGSAAALAARELPLALGTDAGGSIRNPSAYCGVCGLKPTHGRVSRHGVMRLSWTTDCVGPMARSAADLALALRHIAGYDPLDSTSSRRPVEDYRGSLDNGVRQLRVGVPRNWFFDLCDPEVEAATWRVGDVLTAEGAEVVDVALPVWDTLDIPTILRTILHAEAASLHEPNLARIDECSPQFAAYVVSGQFIPAVDYLKAQRARHLLQLGLEEAFEEVDVLLTPGSPSTAPRTDDGLVAIGSESVPWLQVAGRTTAAFSLAGVPALCIPAGLDRRGLPMSAQIVARPHADAICLLVAHAFQRVTDHHRQLPPLLSGV
jgi:aspartyl-tRNA(Asn)/glutamyl-tRNA(Gln) amidotransferase subunit A